jgi:hypothetical protein
MSTILSYSKIVLTESINWDIGFICNRARSFPKILVLQTVQFIRNPIPSYIASTNTTDQSPSWQTDSFSRSQEIPARYGALKFTRTRPLSHSLARQQVHAFPSYLRSILISSTHLRLGPIGCFLSSVFPMKTLHAFLISPQTCYLSGSSHTPWCYHTNIWRGVQIMKFVVT